MPTSETRTQASITMPLSTTRSRTSMRLVPLATRSRLMALPRPLDLDRPAPAGSASWIGSMSFIMLTSSDGPERPSFDTINEVAGSMPRWGGPARTAPRRRRTPPERGISVRRFQPVRNPLALEYQRDRRRYAPPPGEQARPDQDVLDDPLHSPSC